MKKITGIISKILIGIILLILLLLFIVPVIFKEQIRKRFEQAINHSVNATVKFEDYNLGFFRNFPNLSFSLNNLSVVGVDKFENDTLAAFKSFSLVFNLSSLLKKSGYEVKSIVVDRAVVNAIVLKDGSLNWDILKDTGETATAESETKPSSLKILLKKVSLINSSLSYIDAESDMKAYMNKLSFNMKGDMTMSETDMQMLLNIGEFTFIMDGMKYLNKTVIVSKLDLLANLDKMKFTFLENYLTVNDLTLNFSGMVSMPGDDIETDIRFASESSTFSSLLSLIPAVYMKDYKGLSTGGEFSFSGTAKGVYSEADSTMPDLALDLSVDNGLISYSSLPEQIRNINIKSNLFMDGKDPDKTTVSVDRFHMELAGNPFDMTLDLKTPISDPDFKGSMVGRIDLAALSKAMPLDSIILSGIIDMSVQMSGRMSVIEKEQYQDFKASGNIGVQNLLVAMKGYPDVKINRAGLEFTPAYATMTNTNLTIAGKSDFVLSGRLSNYIPYLLKDQTIRGNLSMRSKLIDLSEIMSKMASDTSEVVDTTSLAVLQVPKNIDFDFDAMIDEFRYDKIIGQKVKGHIILRDGILTIKETGMNIMNGTLSVNADYDTRDTLKPVMKAELDIQNIGIKDAFKTFNTVKEITPAAAGIDGEISASLAFKSLLGSDMLPLASSISGEGKLKSDEITLVESETYNKMKELLKLGGSYNNTFRDVNISFKINNGRIYVSPFDVKTGNLKMNISGDQGIDKTLNYIVRTEMPRSDLGSSVNALIDNLAAQAASFGIAYKPSEVIKLNFQVTGTFSKPLISPFFGNTPGESLTGTNPSSKEVAGQSVDNVVEKGKEKARAEAEIQAVKLVKEAENKAQIIRGEAAKNASNIRKEADIQAKKLIDDSASKSTFEKMTAQKGAETLRKTADKQASHIVKEADIQAVRLVEEAKIKGDELVRNI